MHRRSDSTLARLEVPRKLSTAVRPFQAMSTFVSSTVSWKTWTAMLQSFSHAINSFSSSLFWPQPRLSSEII